MKRIVLALMALVLLAGTAHAASLEDLMVESVGDLTRIELISGAAAQAEVDELHGKSLVAEESVVARYMRAGDDGRPAEVWVSRVESEREARRQTGLMVHKMYENPRSPFKDPKRIEHNAIGVYRFVGMGQVHLIWCSGDLVYWISAAGADQAAMLDAFCK